MQRLPRWDLYRTIAGPVAGWVDVMDLTAAAFNPDGVPPFPTFEAHGFETALIYWTATGADRTVPHTVTFEPLFRDGINGLWVTQPVFTLNVLQIGEMPVHHSQICGIRVHAQVAGASTGLIIRVAGGLEARR